MLTRRRVLLAVTGGVAAYKSAYLARRLVEVGAEVRVALSESALEFVGAQTFAAITGAAPYVHLFDQGDVSPHTNLARWADLVIVAPATAATISRAANGLSDDLISATLLATQRPILYAPAMHTEMWENAATQRNVALLKGDGHGFVGPSHGALAGGDVGMGRMAEPEEIIAHAESILDAVGDGLTVLVTAGGTREAVDPVRYLGNRSSGKMGHAVAEEAARRGYQVTLITTSNIPVSPMVKVIQVESADEMRDAVEGVDANIAVMAAAVADFRPSTPSDRKLARSEGLDEILLEPTTDILAGVVGRDPKPFVIGFAAETGDVDRAIAKAQQKNVDLLVYNNVAEEGSGFGADTNRVAIIGADGSVEEWPLLAKSEVAARLWDLISSLLSTAR